MANSFLFYGPKGVGKKRLVAEKISKIVGHNLLEEAIFSGKIEDIFLLEPLEEEKKGKKNIKDISVEQTRAAINFLNFLPIVLNKRFLIVDQAEKMNLAAGNSLLKIVEEPPQRAVIIFLAENLENILPTLISRLEKIHLPLLSEVELEKHLKKQKAFLEEERLRKIIDLSFGRVVLAEKYLTDEILLLSQENRLNEFRLAVKGSLVEGFSLAENLANDKKSAQEAIDNWIFYLRKFLVGSIVRKEIGLAAEKKLVKLIEELLKVKEKLKRPSVNARLVWENFFLSIN